jgi:hypothetical protein
MTVLPVGSLRFLVVGSVVEALFLPARPAIVALGFVRYKNYADKASICLGLRAKLAP